MMYQLLDKARPSIIPLMFRPHILSSNFDFIKLTYKEKGDQTNLLSSPSLTEN
jgi:hypothetical protein